jgi:hypothetical protein
MWLPYRESVDVESMASMTRIIKCCWSEPVVRSKGDGDVVAIGQEYMFSTPFLPV